MYDFNAHFVDNILNEYEHIFHSVKWINVFLIFYY